MGDPMKLVVTEQPSSINSDAIMSAEEIFRFATNGTVLFVADEGSLDRIVKLLNEAVDMASSLKANLTSRKVSC
jgi:hypothetical protein